MGHRKQQDAQQDPSCNGNDAASMKEDYKRDCLGAIEERIYEAQDQLKACIGRIRNEAADSEGCIFDSTDDVMRKCVSDISMDATSAARWLGVVQGLKMAWRTIQTVELDKEKAQLLDEVKAIQAEVWGPVSTRASQHDAEALHQRLDAIDKRLGQIEMQLARIRLKG